MKTENKELMSIIEYQVKEFLKDYAHMKIASNGNSFGANARTLAKNIYDGLNNDLREETVYFGIELNTKARAWVVIKKYDYNMIYMSVRTSLEFTPDVRELEFRTYKNRII